MPRRQAVPQTRTGESENPLVRAVERVGDRWTLLIVDALMTGPRRFGDLQGDVEGIAPNILSSRLRTLEQEGLVHSRPYSRKPVRLAYDLTASGRELAGALRLLAQWGASTSSGAEALRHADCGTPMEARWYCPTCARVVDEVQDGALELRYV
jgi:DNA-binding HxlR family transcriptional regulator